MLAVLGGFIYFSIKQGKNHEDEIEDEIEDLSKLSQQGWLLIALLFIIGLTSIIWGADLLVDGAVTLARKYGISEEIIGLTLIAIGTSLPELATSIVAAFKHENDVALGNIIGSNIWNILFIIGGTSAIVPIHVTSQIAGFDIWAMLASTFVLLPLMLTGNILSRLEGGFLLLYYFGYIGFQFLLSQGAIVLP